MLELGTAALQLLPPETAHHLAIKLLRYSPIKNIIADLDLTRLKQNYFDLDFTHPIGLAAGFDKDAEVFDQLEKLGFAFVEIGSVTPLPQPGNPKPRLFRLKEQQAIINRYGFNSAGLERVEKNLAKFSKNKNLITGINLGKNKNSASDIDDFLIGAEKLKNYGKYFTINISSPNTPGLRDLQNPIFLKSIFNNLLDIVKNKPLFVKLSPDMEITAERKLIEFLAGENISGIIISNTTVSRVGMGVHKNLHQTGGLSGLPLKQLSNAMLARAYQITQGKVLLIGSGGIATAQDAYEKILLGANLLQIYTAFIYQGPKVLRNILIGLNKILANQGVKNIKEILGSGLHFWRFV